MWIKGRTPYFGNIRRILLIQLGDIGDVVLSLPCIRALHEHFPAAQVVVAVRAKAAELIENSPWAMGVIRIEQPRLKLLSRIARQAHFVRRIRGFDFDLVFDLRAGTRGAIMALLSGARLRIGFHSAKEPWWRNLIFTHLLPFVFDAHRHQSALYRSLLTASGIPVHHPLPEIDVPQAALDAASTLLRRHDIPSEKYLVVLHPFSLWRYKEWPVEKVSQLAHELTNQHDLSILVIGSAAERERAQLIVDQCGDNGAEGGGPRVVNLAGETSLLVLSAIIKQSRLLIGMDSAGGHIAAAVGTPSLILFGPGRPGVWAPLGERQHIVHMDLVCIHCGQKGCGGSERSRCLEQLEVAQVVDAAAAQLHHFPPHEVSEPHWS